MLEIRTANGAGRGVIEQTTAAALPNGAIFEAIKLFICYNDGRTIRYNISGEELKQAIAGGQLKLFGRMLNRQTAQALNRKAGSRKEL